MKPVYLLLPILFFSLCATAQYHFNIYSGWTPDVPLKRVGDIEVADDNTVWAVNRDQLVSFDGTTWQVYDTSNCAIPMASTHKLVALGTDLWVGTRGQGLFKLDAQGNTTAFHTGNSGLLNDTIIDLHKDSQGSLYLLTKSALMRFDGLAVWADIDLTGTGPSSNMAIGPGDEVWLGQPEGPVQYTGGMWVTHDTVGPCPNSTSAYITADTSGVYFADYENFAVFKNGNWASIPKPMIGTTSAIHTDGSGHLWVGTGDGGFPETANLSSYDGMTWTHHTNNLPNPFEPEYRITDIHRAPNGTVWSGLGVDLIEMTDQMTSIDDEMEFKVSIYPNPAKATTLFTFEKPVRQLYALTLINAQGQVVRMMEDLQTPQVYIDCESLARGLYVAQVQLKGGKAFCQKIMVN